MKNLLILAYHRVLPDEQAAKEYALAVKVTELKEQLTLLLKKKYQFITLETLYRNYLSKNKKLSKKTCVITFDDGYMDNYLYGFPVLKKYNIPATVFVTTGYIGKKRPYYWDLKNKIKFNHADLSLDWQEMKELKKAGWEIASHTLHHWEINKLPVNILKKELTVSKKILDQKLKQKTISFCAPRGAYGAAFIAAIKEAGYLAAVVTPGVDDFPETNYTLKRVGLYGHDNFLKFKFKISWLFNFLRKLRANGL